MQINPQPFVGMAEPPRYNPKGFTVPICDSLGYSQHFNECASDTAQELFLFADHLRQVTQPFLYKASREALMERVRKTQPPMLHSLFFKYVYDMQERFQRHYDVLQHSGKAAQLKRFSQARRATTKSCALLAVKKARSAELGPKILRRVKELALDTSTGGATMNSVLWAMTRLIAFFELPCELSGKWTAQTTAAFIDLYKPASKIHHALGIFKCNDAFLWYDNVTGITPINMEVVKRLHNVCVWRKTLYFQTQKRITHAWNAKTQKWEAFKGPQPAKFDEEVYKLHAFACLNVTKHPPSEEFPKPTNTWDVPKQVAEWERYVTTMLPRQPKRASTRRAPQQQPQKRRKTRRRHS
jgi:hypothetical protein